MTIVLGLIALAVYIGLMHHKNMWAWIVVYWAVLTLKNFVEAAG